MENISSLHCGSKDILMPSFCSLWAPGKLIYLYRTVCYIAGLVLPEGQLHVNGASIMCFMKIGVHLPEGPLNTGFTDTYSSRYSRTLLWSHNVMNCSGINHPARYRLLCCYELFWYKPYRTIQGLLVHVVADNVANMTGELVDINWSALYWCW